MCFSGLRIHLRKCIVTSISRVSRTNDTLKFARVHERTRPWSEQKGAAPNLGVPKRWMCLGVDRGPKRDKQYVLQLNLHLDCIVSNVFSNI